MSRNLDEWRRAVALSFAQLATPALAARATGQHRVAQNDEPEPSSAEDVHLAEVAVESPTEYAQRRARENDRAALQLQQQHLDAMRRAGL